MSEHASAVWPQRAPLGMLVFVLSDALAFVALFVARLTMAAEPPGPGPSRAVALELTCALAVVSAAMVLAGWARRRGRARLVRGALGLAALAGAGFVAGQVAELGQLVDAGFVLGGSARASGFFAITGLHGAHVAAGVLATVVVARWPGERPRLAALALYWHFVDLVWLAIALGLYR